MKKIILAVMLLLLTAQVFASSASIELTTEKDLAGSAVGSYSNDYRTQMYFIEGKDSLVISQRKTGATGAIEILAIPSLNSEYSANTAAGKGLFTDWIDDYVILAREDGVISHVDVSTKGFYGASGTFGSGNPSIGTTIAYEKTGSEIYIFTDVNNHDGSACADSAYKITWNVANENVSETVALVNNCIGESSAASAFDKENKVYAALEFLYSYADDDINHTVIYTLPSGEFESWNENPDAPRFLTTEGKMLVVSNDYTTFLLSGATLNTTLTNDFFIRQNTIFSILNGDWFAQSFAGVANPTQEDLGVSSFGDYSIRGGYDLFDSPYLATLNVTSNDVYLWTYSGATAECNVEDGCFMNVTFSYADSVLNHDWLGSSVSPNGEAYVCDGSYQESYYYINPFSPSNGNVILSFDAEICSADGAELYMSMGDGATAAWALSFRDGGAVVLHDGEEYGTFTECDGTKQYDIVMFTRNEPPSLDLYEDASLLASGMQYTEQGAALSEIGWFLIGSNVLPEYCNYTIDNIEISAASEDFVSIANDSANRWGPIITQGDDRGFDFSLCRADEDANWCFLRTLSSSIFNGIGDFIKDNPIQTAIFFIVLFTVLAVMGAQKR